MKNGFTLIELLVVITMIVLLLALLTPALDKAIYQAELAVCGANVRAVTGGALVYAASQRRHYPAAPDPRSNAFQPDLLGWEADSQRRDLRPIVQDYLNLDSLLCPLTGPIDLSFEANATNTQVFANYDLWFGWQYTGARAGSAMKRMGDRWGFHEETGDRGFRSRLLASDLSMVYRTEASQATHPDADGVMANNVYQNQEGLGGTGALGDAAMPGAELQTVSRWGDTNSVPTRGVLELNFGLDDGSVTRVSDVALHDSRLHLAPIMANSNLNADKHLQVLAE